MDKWTDKLKISNNNKTEGSYNFDTALHKITKRFAKDNTDAWIVLQNGWIGFLTGWKSCIITAYFSSFGDCTDSFVRQYITKINFRKLKFKFISWHSIIKIC